MAQVGRSTALTGMDTTLNTQLQRGACHAIRSGARVHGAGKAAYGGDGPQIVTQKDIPWDRSRVDCEAGCNNGNRSRCRCQKYG